MEFNALPSQGAGSHHNPSDSKKDTAEGFEDALEKAMAESGMSLGVPTFIQNEVDLPSTELAIPRSDDSLREQKSLTKDQRLESQERAQSDDLDWKELEGKGHQDVSGDGTENESNAQGGDKEGSRGKLSQTSTAAHNQAQQATPAKASLEASGSIQSAKTHNAGASKAAAPAQSPGKLADRILQIVTKMNEQGQKVHKAVMRLRPEKLGLVEVEIKLEDGRLSVRLTAEQMEARNLLQSELERIREVLTDQGFDTIDMQLENGKQGKKDEQGSQKTSMLGIPESIDPEKESIRNWDGLVDLLA